MHAVGQTKHHFAARAFQTQRVGEDILAAHTGGVIDTLPVHAPWTFEALHSTIVTRYPADSHTSTLHPMLLDECHRIDAQFLLQIGQMQGQLQ